MPRSEPKKLGLKTKITKNTLGKQIKRRLVKSDFSKNSVYMWSQSGEYFGKKSGYKWDNRIFLEKFSWSNRGGDDGILDSDDEHNAGYIKSGVHTRYEDGDQEHVIRFWVAK